MQDQARQVPPEVARYLRGATAEGLQFDFLIGGWDIEGTRYGARGEVLSTYVGTWRAEYLHGGRMVMDDFTVHAPSGEEVFASVTLRTYCETTNRWEMASLPALEPAANGGWFGHWVDGEMRCSAEGPGPDGKMVKARIRFYAIRPDGFRWDIRHSRDEGRTWIMVALLVAKRTS
jgi:hypothetical protein